RHRGSKRRPRRRGRVKKLSSKEGGSHRTVLADSIDRCISIEVRKATQCRSGSFASGTVLGPPPAVSQEGFEPTTKGLRVPCSTTELLARIDDTQRTRVAEADTLWTTSGSVWKNYVSRRRRARCGTRTT